MQINLSNFWSKSNFKFIFDDSLLICPFLEAYENTVFVFSSVKSGLFSAFSKIGRMANRTSECDIQTSEAENMA